MLCLNDIYLVLYFPTSLLLNTALVIYIPLHILPIAASLQSQESNKSGFMPAHLLATLAWVERTTGFFFNLGEEEEEERKKKSVFVAVVLHNVYGKKKKKKTLSQNNTRYQPRSIFLPACLGAIDILTNTHTNTQPAGMWTAVHRPIKADIKKSVADTSLT